MTTLKKQTRRLTSKTEAIITGNGRYPLFSLATLLYGGSLIYKGAMNLRNSLYRRSCLPAKKLPCPVISVGNLTVGGTGKTPMTIHLAQLLTDIGYRVVVISRGYRSLSETEGTVVSDGKVIRCDAAHAGDEPYLMANLLRGVPVVVGKDRYAAGQTAWSQFQPDVIVLDDAFQHQGLVRDLNLVLLDAQAPYGNGFVLPRGPMRESMSSLKRADAIILTRSQATPPAHYPDLRRQVNPRPVFQAFHSAQLRCIIPSGEKLDADALTQPQPEIKTNRGGQDLFVFSGLAHNELFWDTAKGFGNSIIGTRGFADHHPYTSDDMARIVVAAQSAGSTCLVTTDKDFMRLPPKERLPLDLMVLGINIKFKSDQDRWRQFITTRIGALTAPQTKAAPAPPKHA